MEERHNRYPSQEEFFGSRGKIEEFFGSRCKIDVTAEKLEELSKLLSESTADIKSAFGKLSEAIDLLSNKESGVVEINSELKKIIEKAELREHRKEKSSKRIPPLLVVTNPVGNGYNWAYERFVDKPQPKNFRRQHRG